MSQAVQQEKAAGSMPVRQKIISHQLYYAFKRPALCRAINNLSARLNGA